MLFIAELNTAEICVFFSSKDPNIGTLPVQLERYPYKL